MIPKTIHYCWFGRSSKPAEALRLIEGWRHLHPDFKIIEWNEDNFDINICDYVRQAYELKKFAFVSDFARGHALFNEGGVYLDTDVELVAPLDSLLNNQGFIGFEHGNSIATSTLGFIPKHPLMERYLKQYRLRKFIDAMGTMDLTTNVTVMTKLAGDLGLKANGKLQFLNEGVVCLPMPILSPLDYVNQVDYRTKETIAIHHYSHSWGSRSSKLKRFLARFIGLVFGKNTVAYLRVKIQKLRHAN